MQTNYVTRDSFGMYANSASGPGPALMGANTLLGNDVCNKDGEDLECSEDCPEGRAGLRQGSVAVDV